MIGFKHLNEQTWSDLQKLFGEKGACGGCWCMYWRLSHKEYESNKGEGNKKSLRVMIKNNAPLGVIAYAQDLPIGWCSISPKSDLVRLKTSRLFKQTENDPPVWSITCLFVHKDYRNQGLSSKIIAAATEYAFDHGAHCVEAYPMLPKKVKIAPAFAWVGFVSSFKKAGFSEKIQVSNSRMVMHLKK